MGEPQIVQVRLPGAARTYAYEWRGKPLEPGQWVELPGNVVSQDGTVGRVESFGRDSYKGPLKEVVRLCPVPQDPWLVRMGSVGNRADALRIYHQAKAKGLPADRLRALVDAGAVRLRELGAL